MKRKIVEIDSEKCIGCGICVDACHEGAIEMQDGKARLIRDDYCDGLGDCLPKCPADAIEIIEREAKDYDKEAVLKRQEEKNKPLACGCPGTHAKAIERKSNITASAKNEEPILSELAQWPVQMKLVNANSPYFENCKLLVAADCTAFAYGSFHKDFIKDHITIIGCPKLDEGDYTEKLTEILKNNTIKSVNIVRMEVPCCAGIENAVVNALKNSKKMIPWSVNVISTSGEILE